MPTLIDRFMFNVPIWLIGIVLFGGMLSAAWLGSRLRELHGRSTSRKDDEKEKIGDREGLVVSSVMGLLALLIGFTFSLSLDRFDSRRAGVLAEANAIGTTYLRTQLLDAPYRARLSELLFDYARNRLTLSQAMPGEQMDAALATNDRLTSKLWAQTVAAFPSIKGYDFSSSYLETMNEMIDQDAARKAARRAHVPGEVFLLLLIYSFVASGVVGYVLVGDRGRQITAFLFFLFGLTLLVVLDLDRPTNGWIRVSQQPVTELLDFMRANPPASFDTPAGAA